MLLWFISSEAAGFRSAALPRIYYFLCIFQGFVTTYLKGTVMQIEEAMINYRFRVSKIS